jgi:hypothetical protein
MLYVKQEKLKIICTTSDENTSSLIGLIQFEINRRRWKREKRFREANKSNR